MCLVAIRFRHLMLDFVQLLPHCKKDNKLDTKSDRGVINEIAEIKVRDPTVLGNTNQRALD